MFLSIDQVFTKNNAVLITQSDADGYYGHNVNITYGYKLNGYPKTATADIADTGSINADYHYKYSYIYGY